MGFWSRNRSYGRTRTRNSRIENNITELMNRAGRNFQKLDIGLEA